MKRSPDVMPGQLIVAATPIGNLGDISFRLKQAIEYCDFIAAEDTRVTIKLLNHLNIKKTMISYHEHNMLEKNNLICSKILQGENCLLVSDAGMPAISDPGELLVRSCADKKINVTVIPGPCAAISALAISGLDSSRFVFEGFLSVSKSKRKARLTKLQQEERTLIFYEAPHKLETTLQDMFATFGNRKLVLVRELTKLHEQVIRTTLEEAVKLFHAHNKPKGEFVLVLEGKAPKKNVSSTNINQAIDLLKTFINSGFSLSQAARLVAEKTGMNRREIYKVYLDNK